MYRERGRYSAKKTRCSEDNDAKQKEVSSADDIRRPCTNWKNDCVGDQITGENPRALTGASAKVAGNMWKRYICD
jgi:hypothetical protein